MRVTRTWGGGDEVLRQFQATVMYDHESGPEEIGSVSGWIGWKIQDEDLFDATDAINSDASGLGYAASSIIDAYPLAFVENALLIDRMYLEPKWQGHRLSNSIINDLLELLRFDPDSTVVVLQPEPQRSEGGPYRESRERKRAMSKLQSAYRESGLVPWKETDVWWLEFTAYDDDG